MKNLGIGLCLAHILTLLGKNDDTQTFNLCFNRDIIQKNPDKPWKWCWVSQNPNITWEIINNNLDKNWNLNSLSQNTFQAEKEAFIRNKFRDWFMGRGINYNETSIFRELMEKVWSPQNLPKFEAEL